MTDWLIAAVFILGLLIFLAFIGLFVIAAWQSAKKDAAIRDSLYGQVTKNKKDSDAAAASDSD